MSYDPRLQPTGRRVRGGRVARPKRKSVGRIVSMVILTIVGFMVSGGTGAALYFLPAIRTAFNATGKQASTTGGMGSSTLSATPNSTLPPPNAPFNVLLLGSDNDNKFTSGVYLTQAMILVRVDPSTGHVTMFSISRDLAVPLYKGPNDPIGRTDKIDKAYMFGGVQGAISTVENDFNVHVDYYVWIGLKGLVNLINKMGNADVYVTNSVLDDYYPNDLGTGNPYETLRVALLPGPQELDGYHAMEYVRSRHGDIREDLGRSMRQQQVLVALKNKEKLLSITDIPALSAALSGEVSTNMQLTFMASLRSLAHTVTPADITHIVLFPPYATSQVIGSQDVLVPNWSLILPYVHTYFPAAS